ncbi:hypothetical protein Scep_015270 [Stephania cephalantha]|uniref:Uncharacterized protein n=1 Tax=Stephania cephalantha TaxID=152367 RepID=A0AAP0J2W4_9MAGN
MKQLLFILVKVRAAIRERGSYQIFYDRVKGYREFVIGGGSVQETSKSPYFNLANANNA